MAPSTNTMTEIHRTTWKDGQAVDSTVHSERGNTQQPCHGPNIPACMTDVYSYIRSRVADIGAMYKQSLEEDMPIAQYVACARYFELHALGTAMGMKLDHPDVFFRSYSASLAQEQTADVGT